MRRTTRWQAGVLRKFGPGNGRAPYWDIDEALPRLNVLRAHPRVMRVDMYGPVVEGSCRSVHELKDAAALVIEIRHGDSSYRTEHKLNVPEDLWVLKLLSDIFIIGKEVGRGQFRDAVNGILQQPGKESLWR